ncbi:glycine--tRNA ligase subunit beta [Bacillus luteolus]|uniref:Glycine--tRNA ligase beta subunit n=1 Tax=Litchfieldia luteola TaxID=682179 RepID=A0ABR9QHP3_9BACI|nr:glycine--tRNA ligase subunit beta [Cytobacillus luteolus]MBE4908013.1 glycine--tRNA ligase subunit beta [Cytobacillus luteolus]MBP1942796.1 glycyl-tRNA synthetase beta chain [Cytobacillus luteolus]
MNNRDLLLEIGLEEMPARFVTDAMNQLSSKLTNWFMEKNISFDQVHSFSTPRRLAVLVTGVAEKQQDVDTEAKGPAKKIALDDNGEWTKAAIGFARGQGASVEDIYFKEINGVEYVHVRKFVKGLDTKDTLNELAQLIREMSFPKNMRWGNEDLKFVRPIKWVVTLFGNEIIPLTISTVTSDRKTWGHRFLGEQIELQNSSDYEKAMLSQYVIVDSLERKEAIVNQIKSLEFDNNWIVPIDEDLLEEVNNLVEYPTALFGKFEEEFLGLPEEVLITSMKEHQRYFPVKDQNGKLLPYFITIRNGDHKHIETVAKGNEKVLRARLSDADFFYKEDQKLKIDVLVKKLDSIVYHVELGSIGDKVRRVKELSVTLSSLVGLSDDELSKVERAAEICKFDLVTHMVYEFPELQGFMGERYAKLSGENDEVALAINEHYMPRHSEDTVPTSHTGAIVSIADKLDTIIGCFSIGLIPTGSQDPYALRRQAAGIVQILLDKNWDISLEVLLQTALEQFNQQQKGKRETNEVYEELLQFFKMRLKNILSDNMIRYDITEAVLGTNLGNISYFVNRAKVLEKEKETPSFKGAIESLSRVINISKKGTKLEINPSLFASEQEKELYEKYNQIASQVETATIKRDANEAFELLCSLQPYIDNYFDHTMVMAEDEVVKNNRLAQMVHLADIIKLFADTNAILVK